MKKLILAALALVPLSAPAHADFGVKVGLLTCVIDGGVGFVIGSSKDMQCTFTPSNRNDPQQAYSGRINKYGVDVGFTNGAVMQWLVMASSGDIHSPALLAGNYAGASAEATALLGVGANVLFGWYRSVALQPISVSGQTGLNAALAVGALELVSAR